MKTPSRPSPRSGGIALLAVAGSLALATAGMPTARADADTPVAVPGGITSPQIAGAAPFGDTDPSTAENVTFVLTMRGQDQLASAVEAGSQPELSVAEFARKHGHSAGEIKKLTSYLNGFGIQTQVFANGIGVSTRGTAAQYDAALQVQQKNYHVPAWKDPAGKQHPAQNVHSPVRSPNLPKSVANMVTAVLGLDNYKPFSSQAARADASKVASTTSDPTSCAVPTARLTACHLPSDFASRYGVSKLYAQGATGKGQTIGIVTLAALDEGAPEVFWKDYAHLPDTGRTVTVKNIDGGPGAPDDMAGTGETDLDVEQSGGVAPGADVVVYQAPNSDAGWVDAYLTAASENLADSVSSSWGYSETVTRYGVAAGWETPALQQAYDEVYLEMASQRESNFVSSADQGAYVSTSDLGTTDLSVDAPGNSPFVTSAGGTTTPWTGTWHNSAGTVAVTVTVPQERAWGWDYLWQPIATLDGTDLLTAAKKNIEGGGGGYSVLEKRPSYQQGISGVANFSAVPYLNSTNYQDINGTGFTAPTEFTLNANPGVIHGTSSGRAEPDVSADADPYSGYLLYEPSGSTQLQVGWGGTSFVAPQFNGATAVMNESVGHRVGLWNPALYRLARTSNSPVTPINTRGTASTNLYYTGTPGTIYNPAVGLGTPDLGTFAAQLKGSR